MKSILAIWFVANFAIVGIAGILLGRWYLSYPPLTGMIIELALIMLPNLVLAIWALGLPRFRSRASRKDALGWKWSGIRAAAWGVGGFAAIYAANTFLEGLLGPAIPYNLPGSGGPVRASGPGTAVALLLLLVSFVILTVVAEETMFRGFIQGQVTALHGVWAGLLVSTLLFGFRHLPSDIFYARAWSASSLMWISRELQLYAAALILGATRFLGRSTYASAITHCLLLVAALFSL